MHEKDKKTAENANVYKERLNQILDTPISVEGIEQYASNAINQLVALLGDVVGEYNHLPTISSESPASIEDAAIHYFGLNNLDEILDHLARKASEIHQLDAVIDRANHVGSVIVPPSALEITPNEGGEKFERVKILPKLKTLLFVLENSFLVNVNSPTELTITKGTVSENMLRRTSYNLVEIPVLDRKILICDEEHNVTYVFDDSVLQELGVPSEKLIDMTKDEIDALLEKNQSLGKRVVYSTKFIQNLIAAIENPKADLSTASEKIDLKFLYPDAPEGILSVIRIARELEVGSKLVSDAIEALGSDLGEVTIYRFNTKQAAGYTPEQQEKIRQYLDEKGLLAPKPPEGVVALSGLMSVLGVPSRSIIEKAVEALKEELGMTPKYKFGPRIVPGFTIDQQEKIRHYLEESGYFQEAPDGYKTLNALVKDLGLAHPPVQQAVEDLGEQLGVLESFNSRAGSTVHYSPAQQELIRQYLENKGLFAPSAPEGFLTIAGMAEKFSLAHETVSRTINDLGEALGEINQYKFGPARTWGFSPEQQHIILDYLKERELLTTAAPEGTLSFQRLMKHFGMGGDERLRQAISYLEQEGLLGEVKSYRFGSRKAPAIGYTPAQQEIIRQYLINNGLLENKPPAGYLSVPEISRKLGVSNNQVRVAISEIEDKLGDIEIFKSSTQIIPHYDGNQQNIIEQQLRLRGFIDTKPPDGYQPISAVAKIAGVSHATAVRAAEELRDTLGETKAYRFKTLFTTGYSPAQQQIILDYLNQKFAKADLN